MHPKQQGLRFPVKIYTEQLDKQCTHRFTAVKKSSVKRNSEQLDKQYKHRFTTTLRSLSVMVINQKLLILSDFVQDEMLQRRGW